MGGGEGESSFNRGVCFSNGGGGCAFTLGVCPMGGIGFDGKGDFEKTVGWGDALPCPPSPLTMGNLVNYIYQKSE